ncbi:MAG: LacI family DNA-binding transcriptional regulator [Rhizobiaceae bacterium]|nr:LacI family DNA-binding transcriptional regulator [Rhizobiaceae bacterium]
MRSTLIDIAKGSGVSTATVDRVLNNRAGVSGRTRAIVMETATRLGYFGQSEPATECIRLDFVLPEGTNTFIANLKAQIDRQCAAQEGIDHRIHAVEGFNPQSLARKLASLRSATQGIALVALDHPAVREEMRALGEAGVKVVTLASDILHVARTGYVGIDNRAAGRLGGYLLGRLLPANPCKIALFAGSLSYRGHEEREMGFRHIVSEEFRHLEVVQMREIRDDRQRAYDETIALLDRHPDLAGIYNIGGGSSGIGQALDDRRRGRSVAFIGHELTEHSKPLLLSGTMDAVIDQNPRVEAREAIGLLSSAIRGRPFEYHPPRLQVIFRENIPEN